MCTVVLTPNRDNLNILVTLLVKSGMKTQFLFVLMSTQKTKNLTASQSCTNHRNSLACFKLLKRMLKTEIKMDSFLRI